MDRHVTFNQLINWFDVIGWCDCWAELALAELGGLMRGTLGSAGLAAPAGSEDEARG